MALLKEIINWVVTALIIVFIASVPTSAIVWVWTQWEIAFNVFMTDAILVGFIFGLYYGFNLSSRKK